MPPTSDGWLDGADHGCVFSRQRMNWHIFVAQVTPGTSRTCRIACVAHTYALNVILTRARQSARRLSKQLMVVMDVQRRIRRFRAAGRCAGRSDEVQRE
jgi:hypothetical protein